MVVLRSVGGLRVLAELRRSLYLEQYQSIQLGYQSEDSRVAQKISADDITGIVGILPTPSTPNADRWDAVNTVNLPETEKLVRAVVDAGIEFIMTTGTFGECATLTEDELRDFVDCVVRTTGGRRPVFAGITTLNTRDTIRRARKLVELGADGIFSGRPMWLPMDEKAIVRYYRDLAEALPGVPLVVYDNPWAFKGKISPAAYAELAKIPTVVGAKHAGGNLEGDLEAVGSGLKLLPVDIDWVPAAKAHPDALNACWSGGVACAPAPLAALSRAVAAQDWATAEKIHEKVQWASKVMMPAGDVATFISYSIPLGKGRFKGAELIDPGPGRAPYSEAPAEYYALSLESGRRWKQLQEEFTSAPQPA
jgi:dihydrodipicolinate synthase/N-acetylneuraminate lyase